MKGAPFSARRYILQMTCSLTLFEALMILYVPMRDELQSGSILRQIEKPRLECAEGVEKWKHFGRCMIWASHWQHNCPRSITARNNVPLIPVRNCIVHMTLYSTQYTVQGTGHVPVRPPIERGDTSSRIVQNLANSTQSCAQQTPMAHLQRPNLSQFSRRKVSTGSMTRTYSYFCLYLALVATVFSSAHPTRASNCSYYRRLIHFIQTVPTLFSSYEQ